MPKLINKTPKYRKHATGQAVVTLNGRDIYLGAHGTTASKREYNRLIGEFLSNNRTMPASAVDGDYCIAELIAAYWRYCEDYYAVQDGKSTGELGGIKTMLRVVKHLYADADVSSFGPLALRAVRDSMLKLDWSRRYINVQTNRIRRMFKWGVGRELVPAAIWQALQSVEPLREGKTEARENDPITTIDDSYVDAVLPWLNRRIRALVELQRLTGARPGEIVLLRGADISMKNRKLWEFRPPKHKGTHRGHDRVIYLNQAAQDILQPFMTTDLSAYVFSPADAEAERREAMSKARTTPMNQGNRPGSNRTRKPRRAPGARYDVSSYRRAITRACDLADRWEHGGVVIANAVRMIPRWHPHQIRHNTATALRARFGLEAAQVILGHRTLSATQIYAEKNIARAKQIMIEGA